MIAVISLTTASLRRTGRCFNRTLLKTLKLETCFLVAKLISKADVYCVNWGLVNLQEKPGYYWLAAKAASLY